MTGTERFELIGTIRKAAQGQRIPTHTLPRPAPHLCKPALEERYTHEGDTGVAGTLNIRGNSQHLCSSGLLQQGEFGGKNGTAACNQ